MKNYMDKFKTPEEYIRFVVLSEHPAQEGDFKKAMADLAAMSENGHRELMKLPKDKLLDILIQVRGTQAYKSLCVGVSSLAYQLKFGITNEDVKLMAIGGLALIVGTEIFYKNGRKYHANVYDVYAYFRLTPEKVHDWLRTHRDNPFLDAPFG